MWFTVVQTEEIISISNQKLLVKACAVCTLLNGIIRRRKNLPLIAVCHFTG